MHRVLLRPTLLRGFPPWPAMRFLFNSSCGQAQRSPPTARILSLIGVGFRSGVEKLGEAV